MERPSPTLTVDLPAIVRNVEQLRAATAHGALIAVVKANAYGLGAIDVARAALAGGARMLAVARGEELRPLRAFDVQAPVLVLGETPATMLPELAQGDTSFTVWDRQQLAQYVRVAEQLQRRIALHIEIDAGMHRLGIHPEHAVDLAAEIAAESSLALAGVFTHFSCADEADPAPTLEEWNAYAHCVGEMRARGINPGLLHAANSAALVRFPQTHADAVRVGLLLAGISPLEDRPFDVIPAVQLHATIVRVATVPPGEGVGYGRTDAATTVRRIATVAIGYADGTRRGPTPAPDALVHGRRIRRVGRVSMDLTTFDVTEVPAASVGDVVTLIGTDGDETITVEQIARATGTIPWEVLTSISPRVRRVPVPLPVETPSVAV